MSEKTSTTDPKVPKGFQSRKTALEVLIRVNEDGAYSNLALSAALKNCQLSTRDKAFVTLLVQGVTRNLQFIDSVIKPFSKKPIDKLPAVLLNTLRLSIFQLEFTKDIPPSAVLNTATSLAKVCGHQGMASYTTAVLRSYLRAREKGGEKEEELDVEKLAMRFSIPQWLLERWVENYGFDTAKQVLVYSNSQPRIALRTNELNITTEGLESILENAGVKLSRSELVDSCLLLDPHGKGRGDPAQLPGYSEGLFSIQDDTAALVVKVVDAKPGETIIDLCAAPGGKALYLGELMENRGRVVAVDKQGNRLELLKKNRNRLGISNVEVFEADGTTFEFPQLADKLLLDAPCSGTGVLNRKADLRHRRKPEDITTLAELQYALLTNAQRLLKPGGALVYATCSIEKEENEEVIEKFATEFPNFKFDDLTRFFPTDFIERHNLATVLPTGKLQILPTMDGLSGFFIARLIKTE